MGFACIFHLLIMKNLSAFYSIRRLTNRQLWLRSIVAFVITVLKTLALVEGGTWKECTGEYKESTRTL